MKKYLRKTNGLWFYAIKAEAGDAADFYGLMGRFFADPNIRNKWYGGEPIDNDQTYIWFVALRGDQVAAFLSAYKPDGVCKVDAFYADDESKISTLLPIFLDYAEKWAKDNGADAVTGTVRDFLEDHYRAAGYDITSTRGTWRNVRKELTQ